MDGRTFISDYDAIAGHIVVERLEFGGLRFEGVRVGVANTVEADALLQELPGVDAIIGLNPDTDDNTDCNLSGQQCGGASNVSVVPQIVDSLYAPIITTYFNRSA